MKDTEDGKTQDRSGGNEETGSEEDDADDEKCRTRASLRGCLNCAAQPLTLSLE